MHSLTASIKLLITTCAIVSVTNIQSAEITPIRKVVHPILIGSNPEKSPQSIIGGGSGVVISPGFMLTAGHVVPTNERETLFLEYKSELIRVSPIKIDRDKDIALLYSPAIQCPCIQLANRPPIQDDVVYSIGYPLYLMYGIQLVSTGTLQGLSAGNYVTTAITAPGGSGGGLFAKEDGSYKLVGITVAIASTPLGPRALKLEQEQNWLTFSVPLGILSSFLKGTGAIGLTK